MSLIRGFFNEPFIMSPFEVAALEDSFFPHRVLKPHLTRAQQQDTDKKVVHNASHTSNRADFMKQMMRAPLLDTTDQGDKLVVRVDVPGVKKEDVKVQLHAEGDHFVLVVSGERRDELKSDKDEVTESRYGKFVRSVSLPKTIKPSGLAAKQEHGVLTITVPKAEPQAAAPVDVKID